jgi:hypothetical protein
MTFKIKIVIIMLAALASACSVSHQFAKDQLQSSAVCCSSMSEFEYLDLRADQLYLADINQQSHSFNFDTGKSYFISLQLPDFTSGYSIIIKSFALGESIHDCHIFYPELLLLDSQFSVISTHSPATFSLTNASLSEAARENSWGLSLKLESSIKIDNPEIRYLVILTTDSLLSATTPYKTLKVVPVILPGIVSVIPAGKEIVNIPHSPFGRLSVRIAD